MFRRVLSILALITFITIPFNVLSVDAAPEALATAGSDPARASYHQFLTPQQVRQRFSLSRTSVNAAQSWPRSQGFRIVYAPTNNLYDLAEESVAQSAAAFGTSFGMYQVNGVALRSPSSDFSVAASIAPRVQSVGCA